MVGACPQGQTACDTVVVSLLSWGAAALETECGEGAGSWARSSSGGWTWARQRPAAYSKPEGACGGMGWHSGTRGWSVAACGSYPPGDPAPQPAGLETVLGTTPCSMVKGFGPGDSAGSCALICACVET